MKPSNLNPPKGYTTAAYAGVEDSALRSLPEASNISWEDTFFEGDDDVIAVFDFDYAVMEDFNVKTNYLAFLFPPFLPFLILGCHPCFLRKRVQWEVYSQHVCITQDGIRFVRDKRPTLCGLSCTDAGKESKTVPFDKITDCDITEPAGATCCIITNVLNSVHVDTASSGNTTQEGLVRHELTLKGLKDPHKFKKLVWAMKRSNGQTYAATIAGQMAPESGSMVRSSFGMSDDKEITPLLKEIRDELREQTNLMKQGVAKQEAPKDLLDDADRKSVV